MKYGPNFKQPIGPDALATLPELATYDGDAADLQHLRGIYFKTTDAEKLVYVGEREGIVVENDDGEKWRPWKGVEIVELDANGKPIVSGYTNAPPLPKRGRDAMSTADLAALGFTDAELAKLARETLGESWEPDRPGPSDARRKLFDRVMAALHG